MGRQSSTASYFFLFPRNGAPKVTAIEEVKDHASMMMEELLGSFVTHDHTLQTERAKVDIKKKKKKKKKVLAIKIIMQEEDEGMTLLTRNFKRFLKKRMRATSFRRQEDEEKGKEIKRDLKMKEKKENTKDKISRHKCKGFRYVMFE